MFKFELNVPRDEQVVLVNTTENRGLSPEELSEQCVQKIVSVSDEAPTITAEIQAGEVLSVAFTDVFARATAGFGFRRFLQFFDPLLEPVDFGF